MEGFNIQAGRRQGNHCAVWDWISGQYGLFCKQENLLLWVTLWKKRPFTPLKKLSI